MSHGGWYESSCGQLADAGLEIHFLDRRGSGLNPARRGDVDSYRRWIDDVAEYIEEVSAGGLPAILAGISWGGKLAAAVVKSRGERIHGLALICPGMYAKRGPNFVERTLVRLADLTAARRWRAPIPLQDPALFTDIPAWQASIKSDPLVLRRVTLHLARESLALDAFLSDAAEAIRIPTLLMLAGRDRIIDNAKTRQFFQRLSCRDHKLIEYPDADHTLEFGQYADQYVRDLADWCKRNDFIDQLK